MKPARRRPASALIAGIAILLSAGAARADTHWHELAGDAARGAALAAERCNACHGENGDADSPYFPKLAGQSETYLRRQLRELRGAAVDRAVEAGEMTPSEAPDDDGRFDWLKPSQRSVDLMDDAVRDLSDQGIADLARHFSLQTCAPAVGQRPDPPAVLIRCAVCHGNDGVGRNEMTPNIGGQNAEYLKLQLHAFRAAARRDETVDEGVARSNRTMEAQVRYLGDGTIGTLASYYASFPCGGGS